MNAGENQKTSTDALAFRRCLESDRPVVLEIINAAAQAYRGIIPADRWHQPYMSEEELSSEIAHGVEFSVCEAADASIGIMGIQRVRNVRLLRHAYVRPERQGKGVGSALIAHLCSGDGTILVGTWRAATWAVEFYERHGFAPVPDDDVEALLRAYWTVPDRQIETSTVLSSPRLGVGDAAQLIAAAEV